MKCQFCGSQSVTPIQLSKEPSLYECLSCGKRNHIAGINVDAINLTATTDDFSAVPMTRF